MNNTITLTNENQKAIFNLELKGQLSDGYWENAAPMDHWKAPCRAEVVVGDKPSINFYPLRRYNFAADDLLKVVRTRMIVYARLAQKLSEADARDAEILFYVIDDNCCATTAPEYHGIPEYYSSGDRYEKLKSLVELHEDFFRNEVTLPIKDKKASYNLTMLNKDLETINQAFRSRSA